MPRRVAVTGTRGKSGVTRLVAAGLRASGARVLAKTTGSKPVLILPDGSEREIVRAGPASIREQAGLVALAARTGADTLVAEMMSIGPECLATEARAILRPGTLALTNVRLDHLDDMGPRKEDVARALASAFTEGCEIFVPAEEVRPELEAAASRMGARLRAVVREAADGGPGGSARPPFGAFEPNVRLALAVLDSLGVDGETALRGMAGAAADAGSLRVWRGEFGAPPRPAVCVGAFAANDPESSAAALAAALALVPRAGRPLVGILSLREDRGDRTLQWVRAAGEGFFRDFSAVVLVGPPARAALRKIRRLPNAGGTAYSFFGGASPEDLTGVALSAAAREPVVVGLGNFVGAGERVVRYWDGKGTLHGR